MVLVRQERLKKFAELWKQAHLDFYNSQTIQAAELRKQSDKSCRSYTMCKIAHFARKMGGQNFNKFNAVLTSGDYI